MLCCKLKQQMLCCALLLQLRWTREALPRHSCCGLNYAAINNELTHGDLCHWRAAGKQLPKFGRAWLKSRLVTVMAVTTAQPGPARAPDALTTPQKKVAVHVKR
jgi:hypothetical protein